MPGAVDRGEAQHVAHVEERGRSSGGRRPLMGVFEGPLLEDHLVHQHPLHGHGRAHLGEGVGRHRHLDVGAERGLHAQALHLQDRRHAVAHVHLDREGDRYLHPFVLDLLPAEIGHPRHVDEEVVGPEADVVVDAARAGGEVVENRPDAEGRQDVRRDLQTELASDLPRLRVGRLAEVHLATHDHVDQLVARGEPLVLDAHRVARILVPCNAAGTLEVAKGGAAAGIEQRLDRGVRVRGRMVDLRDVVHRGHAVVELRQPAEQLADIDVLRPVDRGEFEQDVLVIGRIRARRARAVVDQDTVGEKPSQRGLELVVVRVDESRHDDAAGRVDDISATGTQVRPDLLDLLALDQHIRLGKVADLRVHRKHGAVADDVAPARPAAVGRRIARRLRRSRREQIERARGGRGERRNFQEITSTVNGIAMKLRLACHAHPAHVVSSLGCEDSGRG